MPKLVTWMNNQRVGELTKLANGAHTFKYAPEWLASRYAIAEGEYHLRCRI